MISMASLIDLSAEQVAQNIVEGRFRPSSIGVPVPCANQIFEHAIREWSFLSGDVRVLQELSYLKFTKANFGERCVERQFFPILLNQSLESLTIGYEVTQFTAFDEDLGENADDEAHQMRIVHLLEEVSSAGTRQSLKHLDISPFSHDRFEPNWMEWVGRLFPSLQSLKLHAHENTNLADLVNCFPNLKSLSLTTEGGTRSMQGIGLVRNLEMLSIDDIRDVTDATELFQLQNLRVLSVPCPFFRPFIRRFRDCLENGLTLPELRYFDCSEAASDIEYDEIVGKLPKLEHFTCIGDSFSRVNLPSHSIKTIGDTVTTLEHYFRQRSFLMLETVLSQNPMNANLRDMPECSPSDLRKFLHVICRLMEHKIVRLKIATYVVANCPKLMELMIDSNNFSSSEISIFVQHMLSLFRKMRKFQFPLHQHLHQYLLETVMTPGVASNIIRPFCLEIVEHALRALSEHPLRESALACLLEHTKYANLAQLERADVKTGSKYLVESMYARISAPFDVVAFHFVLQCLFVLEKLAGLEVFEDPYDINADVYSSHMLLFFGQFLIGVELDDSHQREKIEERILRVFRQIVANEKHSPDLYDKIVLHAIGYLIQHRVNQDENSVNIVATAVSILAKLILSPQRIEDGNAEFYSSLVLGGVQWLLKNDAIASPNRSWIQWHTISGECEAAEFMGTVAEHVYAVRVYVRNPSDAPLYVQHVGMREVVRKLSSGRWNDEPVDAWIVEMAKDVRRMTEPGYARAEKRKAEEEEERDAKKEKPVHLSSCHFT
ncbi:unnamed protein product [Caenorhabditis sp. 36 PRJEB53466]|nr:unnamed protein product [Caenorhabditis sp. 36 PRJEB53466]